MCVVPESIFEDIVVELGQLVDQGLDRKAAPTIRDQFSDTLGLAWSRETLRKLLSEATERMPGKNSERKAVSKLLDLGEESAKSKTARQDQAAAVLGVHRTTILRLERSLLEKVAVGLLETSHAERPPYAEILRGHTEAELALSRYIGDEAPKRLQFLELSGQSVDRTLAYSVSAQSVEQIELLLVDSTWLSPFHWENRQRETLWTLHDAVQERRSRGETPPEIRIRCYAVVPSVRSRAFDDELVCLSWISYAPNHNDRQRADSDEARDWQIREVWGHRNPGVLARSSHASFGNLLSFHQGVFRALWDGVPGRGFDTARPIGQAVKERDPGTAEELGEWLGEIGV
jgi:hypothetical protein